MEDSAGSSKINSIQNGLLLRQGVHRLFDQYLLTVNPDDGYKVVVFEEDVFGYDGRILDPFLQTSEEQDKRASSITPYEGSRLWLIPFWSTCTGVIEAGDSR
ncbi:hypothetical protein HOY80DRAFT_1136401 [Tuber brumale]|nr:hypothetical protein HOY80DRAFT_1136401 [Tuber brumale]